MYVPQNYSGPPGALIGRPNIHVHLRQAVADRAPGERFGALLLGPTGAGKSSVAAWALRRWEAFQRQHRDSAGPLPSIVWLDALEASDDERRYRLGSGDPEWLTRAGAADWLVLDDVGKSCSATVVQLILSRRYGCSLPTIVTSGLTPDELSTHIGSAAVRRIVEFRGEPGVFANVHQSAPKGAPVKLFHH